MHGRKGLVCLYHTQLLVVRNQKVALCYYWAQVPLVMCAGFQVLPSDHDHGGPGRELRMRGNHVPVPYFRGKISLTETGRNSSG
jgi:hypothetical protein